MKPHHKTLTLAGSVILFIFLGIILNDPFHFFHKTYSGSARLLKDYAPKEVTQVTIYNPEHGELVLFKEKDRWFVKEVSKPEIKYRGDDSIIERALLRLTSITRYMLLSENPEQFANMKVDQKNLHIEVAFKKQEPGSAFVLHIGIAGGSNSTNVVRLSGENQIYRAKGRIRLFWEQSLNYYRSKKLFPDHSSTLQPHTLHVELWGKKWGNRNYKLTRNQNREWQMIENRKTQKISKSLFQKFFQGILSSEGKYFYYASQKQIPFAKVEFTFQTEHPAPNNNKKTFEVSKKAGSGWTFLGRSRENPYWLVLDHKITDLIVFFPEVRDTEKKAKQILGNGQ